MFIVHECYSCRRSFQPHPGESRTHCTFCHSYTHVATDIPHAPPPHYPHYPHALPLPSSYFPQALPPLSSLNYPHAPPPQFPHSPNAPPPQFPHSPNAPPPQFPHSPNAPPPQFPHSPNAPPPQFPHSPNAPPPQFPHYTNAPLSLYQYSSHAQPAHAQVSYYQAPPVPCLVYHAAAGAVPGVHGRKKAVLVGVMYRNSEQELKGCINDTNNMKDMLIKSFAFPESCIRILNEAEWDSQKWPTRENIRKAMQWLVQDSQSGDSLVFYFSGHGGNQKNLTGDEMDGYDETLLPMDYSTAGMLVDDEINATLVKPLPTGVKLHAIIDACHSGTVLDLPYLCRMDSTGEYKWEDHRPPSGTWTGTNGGEVFCFTGCDDDQNSSDTMMQSKTMFTGAMTFAFIRAIERRHKNYGTLLDAMRSSLSPSIGKTIDDQGDTVTTPLGKLIPRKHPNFTAIQTDQVPQLSANQEFNIYTKDFFL